MKNPLCHWGATVQVLHFTGGTEADIGLIGGVVYERCGDLNFSFSHRQKRLGACDRIALAMTNINQHMFANAWQEPFSA
jgi:hypothetical protein